MLECGFFSFTFEQSQGSGVLLPPVFMTDKQLLALASYITDMRQISILLQNSWTENEQAYSLKCQTFPLTPPPKPPLVIVFPSDMNAAYSKCCYSAVTMVTDEGEDEK